MTAQCLMVQGTMSSAGKSLLTAALCRIFVRRGLRVAPFKAQNMSNNSYVTPQGEEIGRAQAVQAQAAQTEPTVDMNPILLKPEADSASQVIVLGRPVFRTSARGYDERKPELWSTVVDALDRLRSVYEVVVIEGAGSPAEINLRSGDMANMRVALHADASVLLVGDIDRGGIFAQLHGTLQLLEEEERRLVAGLVINKFRGDIELLRPGLAQLQTLTDKPVLGVVPYVHGHGLPEEDSVRTQETGGTSGSRPDIAVVRLPRISNATDFEPLIADTRVNLRYVETAEEMGRPDLVVLPGTKSTIADLEYLKRRGLARCVERLAQTGTPILGICGGYQMLGREISDADGVESEPGSRVSGLGLLPVTTSYQLSKDVGLVRVRVGALPFAPGVTLEGFEIHMGSTSGPAAPAFHIEDGNDGATDGAVVDDGLVWGTYLHGIFESAELRNGLVNYLRGRRGLDPAPAETVDDSDSAIDRFADIVEGSLDIEFVLSLVGAAAAARA